MRCMSLESTQLSDMSPARELSLVIANEFSCRQSRAKPPQAFKPVFELVVSAVLAAVLPPPARPSRLATDERMRHGADGPRHRHVGAHRAGARDHGIRRRPL